MPWLLIPWLLASPTHQQPRYWLWRLHCQVHTFSDERKCEYIFILPDTSSVQLWLAILVLQPRVLHAFLRCGQNVGQLNPAGLQSPVFSATVKCNREKQVLSVFAQRTHIMVCGEQRFRERNRLSETVCDWPSRSYKKLQSLLNPGMDK